MFTKPWDAVVIGAGPAGSIAAHVLASHGREVLLLDKQKFPRPKVCGCCLNASALKTLDSCGLGLSALGTQHSALNELRVFIDCGEYALPLNGNVCVSREALDAALVRHAVSAGAVFLAETNIQTLSQLKFKNAPIVVAASGLNSTYLDEYLPAKIAADSHLGVGATFDDESKFFTPHTVFMACCVEGYCGLVRLEDNRLNVAAALDANFLRDFNSPGEAAANILRRAGLQVPAALRSARWHGTPLLTRRRERVSAPRLLAIGDAAGYVEPFTGEGMAWAMRSGLLAAKLICSNQADLECAWQSLHDDFIRSQQLSCKLAARLLRTPRLSAAALGLLEKFPALTRLFM